MVPSILVVVNEWPLTPNGKVDKRALPAAELELQRDYVAPETEIEKGVAEIWSELLGISAEDISSKASFYDLGGHSLLTIRLMAKIRQRFEVELPVQAVFDASSLAALAELITGTQTGVTLPALEKVARSASGEPVSFSQQRLWFIDSLQGSSAEYNMPMAFTVQGDLDTGLVHRAFNEIIARHEVLRTVYTEVDGMAQQQICAVSEIDFDVAVEDMCHLTGETQNQAVKSLVNTEFTQPFNLAEDLMLRVRYIKTAEAAGVLLFNMHHIASDGWSMDVLAKEFFTLYEAYSQGKASPLPALDIQYADYAHWQRTHLEGEVLDNQLDYWAKQLDEVPSVHSLPLCYPRPEVKAFEGAVINGALPARVGQQLQAVAKQYQLTPFMLLHGALSLLLARHSNSADVVIGTPVANRTQAELTPLIGFFVNTLVLRADTNHHSLGEYFKHIRQVHLDAQSNQDVPFEQLVDRLNVTRSKAHSPLFQIMMTTNTDYGLHDDDAAVTLPGVQMSAYESDAVTVKFDLDVALTLNDEGVGINWTYDVSLFSEAAIARLNAHLCRLLTSLSEAAGEDMAVHRLAMLSESETQHLVTELNDTALAYDKSACLHERFERQAQDNPDGVAVVFADESLTYQQLNARANQLAHYLRAHHRIQPDSLVGVCADRSLEMIIGILGILKAGGAYVPLDPNSPKERLSYVIEDAQLSLVLSQGRGHDALAEFTGALVALEGQDYAQYSSDNLDKSTVGLSAEHLAYVIYTSGSTGKPKGVMIEHGSGQALMQDMSAWFDGVTRVGWSASYVFDASLQGILYLFSGRTLVIVSEEMKTQPAQLQAYIGAHQIELLDCTPSVLQFWLDAWHDFTPPHLLVGGEAISHTLWQSLAGYTEQGLEVRNVYGPTECTVNSTVAQVSGDAVHIGKTLSYMRSYVLSDDVCKALVPYGSVGELYLGGDGLARGYLNKAGLTAERFIDNPYYDVNDPHSSKRLYRTGDLVRYLPDGHLAFMGRTDDQVKIRGFRIELGEVETQLAQQDSVESALVLAKELAGSQQLVGYIQASKVLDDAAQTAFVLDVKKALAAKVPEYMVPSILVVVNKWPLTPNGKVDKKALPSPAASRLKGDYVPPTSAVEVTITEIWSALLGIDTSEISTTANFFEIGGHSLLILRLGAELKRRLGVVIPLHELFSAVTIAAVAALCAGQSSSIDRELVQPMSKVETHNQAVFLIPGVASTEHDFASLAAKLSSYNINVYVCPHRGLLDGLAPFNSLAENAECLAQAIIETAQTPDVIQLVGHSFGGVLALETANVLKKQGWKVEITFVDVYFEQTTQVRISSQFTPEPENDWVNENELTVEHDFSAQVRLLAEKQITWFDNFVPTLEQDIVVQNVYAAASPYCLQAYGRYMTQQGFENSQSIIIDSDHKGVLKSEELARFIATGLDA